VGVALPLMGVPEKLLLATVALPLIVLGSPLKEFDIAGRFPVDRVALPLNVLGIPLNEVVVGALPLNVFTGVAVPLKALALPLNVAGDPVNPGNEVVLEEAAVNVPKFAFPKPSKNELLVTGNVTIWAKCRRQRTGAIAI
jgi:hypothetical protein